MAMSVNVFAAYRNNYTPSSACDYTALTQGSSGSVSIVGTSPSVTMTVPSKIDLSADLYLDNITISGATTIFANGHYLYIGENVTSTARLSVFGGGEGKTVANTNIVILGGLYEKVYGGGSSGAVTGNTNVVFGGNCNKGDGIDDDASNISPCRIYGGSSGAAVNGTANITLDGNAVTAYVYGAGNGVGATASSVNVFIKGGKAMNVYGGAASCELNNCIVNVKMTGGLVESVFGGSYGANLKGHTIVTLLGGDVSRRVYTGCYNEYETKNGWNTSYHVVGTTALVIGPDMLLNTKNGLSNDNGNNVGVFSGSRIKKGATTEEINTIIYTDGCYSSKKSVIGEKSLLAALLGQFKSQEAYTLNCGAGGTVTPTTAGGKFTVTPNFGKYATVAGNTLTASEASVSSGTTAIEFKDNFASSLASSEVTDGIRKVTVNYTAKNVYGKKNPVMCISSYDSDGKMCGVKYVPLTSESGSITAEFDDFSGMTVKAIISDSVLTPLCTALIKNI